MPNPGTNDGSQTSASSRDAQESGGVRLPTAQSPLRHGAELPVSLRGQSTDERIPRLPRQSSLRDIASSAESIVGRSSTNNRAPASPQERSRSVGDVAASSEAMALREKANRYSILVERDANGELLEERWQIFVDDDERHEAARLTDQATTAELLAYDNLQPIVGALVNENVRLREVLDDLEREGLKDRKAAERERLLNVTFKEAYDKRKAEEWRKSLIEVKDKLRSANAQRPPKESDVDSESESPFPYRGKTPPRTQGQKLILERDELKARIVELEAQVKELTDKYVNRPIGFEQQQEHQDRIAELNAHIFDLHRRHNASQQKLQELKTEKNEIKAERDKYKNEIYAIRKERSAEQLQKLQDQNQRLQDQAEKLSQEKRQLIDMTNEMTNILPGLRNLQTKHQREQQQRFETDRTLRYEQVLKDVAAAEEPPELEPEPQTGRTAEPTPKRDTMEELRRKRSTPTQYATPSPDDARDSDSNSSGESILGNVIYGGFPAAGTLRERQTSGVPAAPGRGLEESRSADNPSLKNRPGSIVRPNVRVRGLPQEAVRGPVLGQGNLGPARSCVSPSASSSHAHVGRQYSRASVASTSGGPIVGQINITRITSELPPDSRASIAWEGAAEHSTFVKPGTPLSGYSPYFNIFSDPVVMCKDRARINFDIPGPDRMYNWYFFKKGQHVFVFEDGMHDIWPVQLFGDSTEPTYYVPRTALTLICDHGHEYTEVYKALGPFPQEHEMKDADSTERQNWLELRNEPDPELVFWAHSEYRDNDGIRRKWHCVKLAIQNDRNPGKLCERYQRCWVPHEYLQKLEQYNGRPLTTVKCPCADAQPYRYRAQITVDYTGSSGLTLKEYQEVEVSHIDTSGQFLCVIDPQTQRQGFVERTVVQKLRKPVHINAHCDLLQLTPRKYEFLNPELQDMELKLALEPMTMTAMRPVPYNWSPTAERLWEQNIDGTNPLHKNFRDELGKSAPDRVWKQWNRGPPSDGINYVRKADFLRWATVERRDWEHKLETWTLNPPGPGSGKKRARSRSVPTLRRPEFLSDAERKRERLIKRAPEIGHQPHRKVADGVCEFRDTISEPVLGEPPDFKRRLIYTRPDGTLIAMEDYSSYDANGLPIWDDERNQKNGQNMIAQRLPAYFRHDMMPFEENVQPFSFEDYYSMGTKDVFGYNEAPPVGFVEEIGDNDEDDPMKIFRVHQNHKLDLVYQFRNQTRLAGSSDGRFTADDRFRIVQIVEGPAPFLLIRRVRVSTGTDSNESTPQGLAEDLDVQPEELDPEPFLRTALMKDEEQAISALPMEREMYQFVLLRESAQASIWDSWYVGEIVPAKLDHITVQRPEHWVTLRSVFSEIMRAYKNRQVLQAVRKISEQLADPTDSTPKVDDWDFYYPVVKDHLKQGPGFLDLPGPDSESGVYKELVRVHSEKYGYCACTAYYSGKDGSVHLGHLNMNDPYLPVYQLKKPFDGRQDHYFILLKTVGDMIFVSMQYHQKFWVQSRLLAYDEQDCQLLSLRYLVMEWWLETDELEGVTQFLDDRKVEEVRDENAAPAPENGHAQPNTGYPDKTVARQSFTNDSVPSSLQYHTADGNISIDPTAFQLPPSRPSSNNSLSHTLRHQAKGVTSEPLPTPSPVPVGHTVSCRNTVSQSSQHNAAGVGINHPASAQRVSNESTSSRNSAPKSVQFENDTFSVGVSEGPIASSTNSAPPSLQSTGPHSVGPPPRAPHNTLSDNPVPAIVYHTMEPAQGSGRRGSAQDLTGAVVLVPSGGSHGFIAHAIDYSGHPVQSFTPQRDSTAHTQTHDPIFTYTPQGPPSAQTGVMSGIVSHTPVGEPPQQTQIHPVMRDAEHQSPTNSGTLLKPPSIDLPESTTPAGSTTPEPGYTTTLESRAPNLEPPKFAIVAGLPTFTTTTGDPVFRTPGGATKDGQAIFASPAGTTPAGAPIFAIPVVESTMRGAQSTRSTRGSGAGAAGFTTPLGAPSVPVGTKPTFVLGESIAISPKFSRHNPGSNVDADPPRDHSTGETNDEEDEIMVRWTDVREREEADKNNASTGDCQGAQKSSSSDNDNTNVLVDVAAVHEKGWTKKFDEASDIPGNDDDHPAQTRPQGDAGEQFDTAASLTLAQSPWTKHAPGSSQAITEADPKQPFWETVPQGKEHRTEHPIDYSLNPTRDAITQTNPWTYPRSSRADQRLTSNRPRRPRSKSKSKSKSRSGAPQNLTFQPAKSLITIPPNHLHRPESELEVAIRWLQGCFTSFKPPPSFTATATVTPETQSRPRRNRGADIEGHEWGWRWGSKRIWAVIYLLALVYLLLGAWLVREEWMDVNGIGWGREWGISAVRGSTARWVWGFDDGRWNWGLGGKRGRMGMFWS